MAECYWDTDRHRKEYEIRMKARGGIPGMGDRGCVFVGRGGYPLKKKSGMLQVTDTGI